MSLTWLGVWSEQDLTRWWSSWWSWRRWWLSSVSARLGRGLALDTRVLLTELLLRTRFSRAEILRVLGSVNRWRLSAKPGIDWDRAMSNDASDSLFACMILSDERTPTSVRVLWLPLKPGLVDNDELTCSRKVTSWPVASSYNFLEFSILLSCQCKCSISFWRPWFRDEYEVFNNEIFLRIPGHLIDPNK